MPGIHYSIPNAEDFDAIILITTELLDDGSIWSNETVQLCIGAMKMKKFVEKARDYQSLYRMTGRFPLPGFNMRHDKECCSIYTIEPRGFYGQDETNHSYWNTREPMQDDVFQNNPSYNKRLRGHFHYQYRFCWDVRIWNNIRFWFNRYIELENAKVLVVGTNLDSFIKHYEEYKYLDESQWSHQSLHTVFAQINRENLWSVDLYNAYRKEDKLNENELLYNNSFRIRTPPNTSQTHQDIFHTGIHMQNLLKHNLQYGVDNFLSFLDRHKCIMFNKWGVRTPPLIPYTIE